MERRNFIQGLFGAVASIPFVGVANDLLEANPKKMRIQVVVTESNPNLRSVTWCDKEWTMPADNGKSFIVDTCDMLGSKVGNNIGHVGLSCHDDYAHWMNTSAYIHNFEHTHKHTGEDVIVKPILTPYDTATGINMEAGLNSAFDDINKVRYIWWAESE